ncbi:hypothetical protein MKW92_049223 [Papaver armeniacum]|nr:hypothetical protein MKW92_049223 [Papaver armeniacum]
MGLFSSPLVFILSLFLVTSFAIIAQSRIARNDLGLDFGGRGNVGARVGSGIGLGGGGSASGSGSGYVGARGRGAGNVGGGM